MKKRASEAIDTESSQYDSKTEKAKLEIELLRAQILSEKSKEELRDLKKRKLLLEIGTLENQQQYVVRGAAASAPPNFSLFSDTYLTTVANDFMMDVPK